MNETPGIPETPEVHCLGLSGKFLAHLTAVRAMMASPVHQNLDHWNTRNHSLAPDTGGGD